MLSLRPARLSDAAATARILSAVHPDEPRGADELRYRWSQPNHTRVVERYMVVDGRRPVGNAFATWPARWTEGQTRYGSFELRLLPAYHDPSQFDRLLAELLDRLEAAGTEAQQSQAREDDGFIIAGLERNGFRSDRLSKAWELDLEANRERLLALRSETRAAMREAGVEMLRLAEAPDPDRYRRMYELDNATTHDIPHTVPYVEPTYEEYLAHLKEPGVHPERIWTAWRDGELVALSFLRYPSVGRVWTGYTCCRRDQRGQGIARAVKMETLGEAIELGVDRVRTDNDEQNAPMLHINEALGYYRIPGFLQYLRP